MYKSQGGRQRWASTSLPNTSCVPGAECNLSHGVVSSGPLPDDSTQLIIISLSVSFSLRLVSESGSGFWQRQPRGERLEVTACAAAAFSLARGPGSPHLPRSWWQRPRDSGRASSGASGCRSQQPPQPPSPQPFLSRTGLLPEGVKGSFSPLSPPPPPPSPPPLALVPLWRSPPFPLLLLPHCPPPPSS